MQITLQYFDGCPNWEATDADLKALVADRGLDVMVRHQVINTSEAAIQYGFRGSPTVLIDGVDPFADPDTPIGLACRIYATEHGPAGSPSLDQLAAALTGAARE